MIKSEKNREVAELLFDLQLFAEVDPPEDKDIEDIEEDEEIEFEGIDYFADLEVEDDEETDEEESPEDDSEEGEVADPQQDDEKPFQDDKANSAFAEMRRAREEAERRSKLADELISMQFGESHGIHTVEQYQEALYNQRLEEKGISKDDLNKAVEEHPLVKQAMQKQYDEMLFKQYSQVQGAFPDLIKKPEDIQPEVWQKWNDGNNGLTLEDAYFLVNRNTILSSRTEKVKNHAIKNVNSKNHIKATGTGEADIETTTIPPDTLAMYKELFPNKTMKEFIQHYKKSQGR